MIFQNVTEIEPGRELHVENHADSHLIEIVSMQETQTSVAAERHGLFASRDDTTQLAWQGHT